MPGTRCVPAFGLGLRTSASLAYGLQLRSPQPGRRRSCPDERGGARDQPAPSTFRFISSWRLNARDSEHGERVWCVRQSPFRDTTQLIGVFRPRCTDSGSRTRQTLIDRLAFAAARCTWAFRVRRHLRETH
jgi:hypothetical protein